MHLVLQISKIISFLSLIAFSTAEGQKAGGKDNTTVSIRMGYSSVMLQDTKPADAKAAIYIWADVLKNNILVKYNQKSDLSPYIYFSEKEMEDALDKNEIDILGLTATEYFSLNEKHNLVPAIVGTIDESIYTQYILIVRSDSGFRSYSGLRGKKLAQAKDRYNPLINAWLYSLLKKQKEPDKNKFFGSIKYEEKEANAAYSVYFKKADCAVIQKSVYNTICSLNPQFKSSLTILETSPDLIPALTTIRKNADPVVFDLFYKTANNIHETTEGQNIIKLFRAKKLVEINDADLAGTKKLIDDYNIFNKK